MSNELLTGQSTPLAFKGLGGGLNSNSGPLVLEVNESSDLQNIDFNRSGSILKRSGYTQHNTTALNAGATVTSLHWCEFSNGNTFLVATCGNKIFQASSLVQAASPYTDITGAITITAGNNNLFYTRMFLDTLLLTNGVDAPFQWTGSGNVAAMTLPAGVTLPKYIDVFQNYLVLANVTTGGAATKSRVHWYAINSITTAAAADFNDVSRNDGTEITGTRVLGEEWIIFKNRSIWKAQFTGDRDIPFVFFKTRSEVGCSSPWSIQEVQNGLVFQSYDGFYFFDGNNSHKISERITNTLGLYNLARIQFNSSAYQRVKNRYWCSQSASGSGTHNRVVAWDSFNDAFSVYNGINANAFAIVYSSGAEQIYFGDYAGFVYRADNSSNDNPSGTSTAINAYFYTKWLDYDDIVNQKGTPQVYIYYQIASSTLTFAYSFDFESADTYSQSFSLDTSTSLYGTAVYGTGTYASAGGAVSRRSLTGRGRVIRLKFSNNVLGEGFQVDGFGALPYLETPV